MRIIVCGSRDWHDRQLIQNTLADLALLYDLHASEPLVIVHGAARGADRIAGEEAQKLGLLVEAHPADWKRFGKSAGPMRNMEMAALGAGLCVAFWKGGSKGTADMMLRARNKQIPLQIVYPTGETSIP